MTTETHISKNGIKVTEHFPDKGEIPEYIRQQKINQLYDLLAPKADNSTIDNDTEN